MDYARIFIKNWKNILKLKDQVSKKDFLIFFLGNLFIFTTIISIVGRLPLIVTVIVAFSYFSIIVRRLNALEKSWINIIYLFIPIVNLYLFYILLGEKK